ncbi:Chaperone protein DnaK [Dirofilaria immitis]
MARWWITFIILQIEFTTLIAQNKTSNSVLPLKKRYLIQRNDSTLPVKKRRISGIQDISSQENDSLLFQGNLKTGGTPVLSREENYYNNWKLQQLSMSSFNTSPEIRDHPYNDAGIDLDNAEDVTSVNSSSDSVLNLSLPRAEMMLTENFYFINGSVSNLSLPPVQSMTNRNLSLKFVGRSASNPLLVFAQLEDGQILQFRPHYEFTGQSTSNLSLSLAQSVANNILKFKFVDGSAAIVLMLPLVLPNKQIIYFYSCSEFINGSASNLSFHPVQCVANRNLNLKIRDHPYNDAGIDLDNAEDVTSVNSSSDSVLNLSLPRAEMMLTENFYSSSDSNPNLTSGSTKEGLIKNPAIFSYFKIRGHPYSDAGINLDSANNVSSVKSSSNSNPNLTSGSTKEGLIKNPAIFSYFKIRGRPYSDAGINLDNAKNVSSVKSITDSFSYRTLRSAKIMLIKNPVVFSCFKIRDRPYNDTGINLGSAKNVTSVNSSSDSNPNLTSGSARKGLINNPVIFSCFKINGRPYDDPRIILNNAKNVTSVNSITDSILNRTLRSAKIIRIKNPVVLSCFKVSGRPYDDPRIILNNAKNVTSVNSSNYSILNLSTRTVMMRHVSNSHMIPCLKVSGRPYDDPRIIYNNSRNVTSVNSGNYSILNLSSHAEMRHISHLHTISCLKNSSI